MHHLLWPTAKTNKFLTGISVSDWVRTDYTLNNLRLY